MVERGRELVQGRFRRKRGGNRIRKKTWRENRRYPERECGRAGRLANSEGRGAAVHKWSGRQFRRCSFVNRAESGRKARAIPPALFERADQAGRRVCAQRS